MTGHEKSPDRANKAELHPIFLQLLSFLLLSILLPPFHNTPPRSLPPVRTHTHPQLAKTTIHPLPNGNGHADIYERFDDHDATFIGHAHRHKHTAIKSSYHTHDDPIPTFCILLLPTNSNNHRPNRSYHDQRANERARLARISQSSFPSCCRTSRDCLPHQTAAR